MNKYFNILISTFSITSFILFSLNTFANPIKVLKPGEMTADKKYICSQPSSQQNDSNRMQCTVMDNCGFIKRKSDNDAFWKPTGCASTFGHATKAGAYDFALATAVRVAPDCEVVYQ